MTSSTLPIYLLPGMTADFPIYDRLIPLLPNVKVVPFLVPEPNESLIAFAARMANQMPSQCSSEDFIGGISFGGILALEICRLIRPAGCILISTISDPSELPPWMRVWRLLGARHRLPVIKALGNSATWVPKRIRTHSTIRITKLSEASGAWHRWATSAVLGWDPDSRPRSTRILKIHGTADTTFPLRYTYSDVVVRDGLHDLPLSHPRETADAITAFTNAKHP